MLATLTPFIILSHQTVLFYTESVARIMQTPVVNLINANRKALEDPNFELNNNHYCCKNLKLEKVAKHQKLFIGSLFSGHGTSIFSRN